MNRLILITGVFALFVTVGCMYISNLCDPDLRIWSISQVANPFPFPLITGLVIVVASVIVVTFLLIKSSRTELPNNN